MDRYAQTIKKRLDQESTYRAELFCRGYLITDAKLDCLGSYPFYGTWKHIQVYDYLILVHPEASVYQCDQKNQTAVLIGHAYDPIGNEIREEIILQKILDAFQKGKKACIDAVNDLTGVFILLVFTEQSLWAVQDCGGQKMLYFGKVGSQTVITSIPQLAADVFNLHWDENIIRLVKTKGYYRGSGFLPGNLSPYLELKRLGANTCLFLDKSGFRVSRIYPLQTYTEFITERQKKQATEEMFHIFSDTLNLIMRKWPRVGLSLTGGIDSKTTLACAKPHYGDFFCYSFESKDSERLDSDAAEKICNEVGLEHHRYLIPNDPESIQDYDFLHNIIEHNTSHICKLHPNEIRKYIWLRRQNDFDVEIKSDMSEVGRAYSSRKYLNVKLPRILSPRHLTITQARYFQEPWAMAFADNAYSAFMQETKLMGNINGYSMHDLAYWEVRMSAWAATSLASQEFFHEITIPYNNRKLLDLFLSFPEEERKKDQPHKRLMSRGNPVVSKSEFAVKDSYLAAKRMLIETFYYYYATRGNTLGKK